MEIKEIADAGILYVCRVCSRMCEFATHKTVGEDENGSAIYTADQMILQTFDEELPGFINDESVAAVKEVYPLYGVAFAKAFDAVKALDPKDGALTQELFDETFSILMHHCRRLYQVNSTL